MNEESNGVIVAPRVTPEQLALVKRTVANGATDAELQLYLHDCARQGVHPLDRLLHFTKRGGKYTPVTSIDLMRTRAADTGEYAGSDDAAFTPPAEALARGGHPDSAAVTVWRLVQGQRCSFTATARWSEYFPGDQSGHMWKKMPHTMLAKCAEALALRKGFPRQLAGLYAREEMEQAGASLPPVEPSESEIDVPEGCIVIRALKPPPAGSTQLLRGIAVTHAGEELHVTRDELWALCQELEKSRAPMVAETGAKGNRTFLRGLTSPESRVPKQPDTGAMLSADSIPF